MKPWYEYRLEEAYHKIVTCNFFRAPWLYSKRLQKYINRINKKDRGTQWTITS
jgi:hypothetical protein